jgi:hypothetical protein
MFHVVVALDGVADIVELLEVNQPLQSISPGETFDEPRAVLVDAADEGAGHAAECRSDDWSEYGCH